MGGLMGGGGEVLFAVIGALSCALLQDYYINCSDLITLEEGNGVCLSLTHTHHGGGGAVIHAVM